MNNEKVDVLVIGAGPAGTVAASIIKQKGYSVKIVEKEKFPRFVIGESLLPRCMEALEEAKFLDAVKAMGFQEKTGAKFVRNNQVCDFSFSDQFTDGWKWAYQVPRMEFDNTLATEVAKMGVDVNFETTVTHIEFTGSNSTTTIQQKDGSASQIDARFIVDASGYGRVIPRLFNLDKPSNIVPRKTLFAHFTDPKRMEYDEPNRIIVIDHQPQVWIWVIPFSNGVTSVGFVGKREFFEGRTGSAEEVLREMIAHEPHIAERFKGSEFLFEPRTIEGWSVSTEKFYGDGFVLTGNVTEFLDPVFSSGVTLAVESSRIAAKLVCRQLAGEVLDWEEEYTKVMMQGVDTFRTYVMAWYDGSLQDIFFTGLNNESFKKQICSVLAGYVWDQENLFVKKHAKAVKYLAQVIRSNEPQVLDI